MVFKPYLGLCMNISACEYAIHDTRMNFSSIAISCTNTLAEAGDLLEKPLIFKCYVKSVM